MNIFILIFIDDYFIITQKYENFQIIYPEIFTKYVYGIFNPGDVVSVHPTQLYESLTYFLLFIFLIKIREKMFYKGYVIYQYLLLAGLSRFIIEFYRVNPKYILGLSGAQCISFLMIIVSLIFI